MFEIEALEAILATVNNEAQRCGHTLCTPHNNMSAETPKHRPASMVNNIRMRGGRRGEAKGAFLVQSPLKTMDVEDLHISQSL